MTNYGLLQNYLAGGEEPTATVSGYIRNTKEVEKLKFFSDVPALSECPVKLKDLLAEGQAGTPAQKEYGTKYVDPTQVRDGKAQANEMLLIGPVVLEAFGIIEGYPDGTFRGYNELTRAEAITILNRLAVPLARVSKLSVDDYFKVKVNKGVFAPDGTELPYCAVKEFGTGNTPEGIVLV